MRRARTPGSDALEEAARAIRLARNPNPSRSPFITDMGESPELVADDGSRIRLGRYGVWTWNGRKHEVAETGDDLAELQRRHGISEPPVRLGLRRNGDPGADAQALFNAVSARWKAGDLRHPREIVGPRPEARKPQWVWDVLVLTMGAYGFPKDVDRLLRKVTHTCHLDFSL